MKKFISVFIATILLNGYFAYAQPRTLNGSNFQGATLPLTTPAGISQLQVQGRLFTQNAQNIPAGTQITGSFAANARWNSMGNLPAGTQTLNGFRTQTDGRALAWGHSIPNAGTVSNGFIEWIGNNATGVGVTPGSLEFRYAVSPTSAAPIKLFQMDPPTLIAPSFAYAARDASVGQLQNGAFGSFGATDIWSATGRVVTPNFETYGARQQYNGRTLITGLLRNNLTSETKTVIDFGSNSSAAGVGSVLFQFRTFTNATNAGSYTNIFQSSNKFNNMVVAEREYFNLNSSQFKFSVFDGGTTVDASATAVNFVERHNNYNVTDGIRIVNGNETRYGSVAAVTGDVSNSAAGVSYAVLGITDGNYTGGFADNPWAGYFIGRVGYTGNLVFVSDKKFKKEINDEISIMDKIKQLSPKNYFFDTQKNKNMAFSGKLQHGFISEELEKVFPELVEEGYAPSTSTNAKTNGKPEVYKGVNYVGLIPILTKAIQEQQNEIDLLKKQVASLQNTETFVVNKVTTPAEKEILDNKAFMLAQNVPNPFTQNTIIKYSLPNASDRAAIVIFNLNGALIQQFNLPMAKGTNQITVNGGSLTAGKYIYSLLVNGEEVISKTMVLTK
jgi:hypothetical protein